MNQYKVEYLVKKTVTVESDNDIQAEVAGWNQLSAGDRETAVSYRISDDRGLVFEYTSIDAVWLNSQLEPEPDPAIMTVGRFLDSINRLALDRHAEVVVRIARREIPADRCVGSVTADNSEGSQALLIHLD